MILKHSLQTDRLCIYYLIFFSETKQIFNRSKACRRKQWGWKVSESGHGQVDTTGERRRGKQGGYLQNILQTTYDHLISYGNCNYANLSQLLSLNQPNIILIVRFFERCFGNLLLDLLVGGKAITNLYLNVLNCNTI